MQRKIAFFVEGATEREFVLALVKALVGTKNVDFAIGKQFTGKVTYQATVENSARRYFVLIVDCATDEQVKTQLLEEFPTLVAAGYSAVIGLMDAYPRVTVDPTKLAIFVNNMQAGMPTAPFAPQMHVAVMETESWFIGEVTHFAQIHDLLTVPYICANGISIHSTPAESWPHPAQTLHEIYQLVSFSWMSSKRKKSNKRILRTIEALSIDHIYFEARYQLQYLNSFLDSVDAAFY